MAVPTTHSRSAKPATTPATAKSGRATKMAATENGSRGPRKMASRTARLISSKLAYKGKVFSVYTDRVEEPGGSINERDVIRHNGSVVILAIDESKNPRDPDVILERQYRHAAGRFLLELPAGRIEPNEAPLAAAKREMIEETGFRAKRWTLLTKYFASPGFLGERADRDCAHAPVGGNGTGCRKQDPRRQDLDRPLTVRGGTEDRPVLTSKQWAGFAKLHQQIVNRCNGIAFGRCPACLRGHRLI
jgi:ADP-ribose pyrophosphatase